MKRLLLLALPLLMSASSTDNIQRPKKDGSSVVIQSVTSGGVATDALTVGTGGVTVTKWSTSNTWLAPTMQKFTSGSGTYTTPTGVAYIRVRMVGGGGGAPGSGTAAGTGATSGGSTTFGSSLLTANGGSVGLWGSSTGGVGGTGTIASPAFGVAVQGQGGSSIPANGGPSNVNLVGGAGGMTPFGGGCMMVLNGSAITPVIVNTGSGGCGGSVQNSALQTPSSGGGAGGYIDAIIASPSASYSYAVGSGGSGGAAGPSGNTGGAGSAGIIIVEEFFN